MNKQQSTNKELLYLFGELPPKEQADALDGLTYALWRVGRADQNVKLSELLHGAWVWHSTPLRKLHNRLAKEIGETGIFAGLILVAYCILLAVRVLL